MQEIVLMAYNPMIAWKKWNQKPWLHAHWIHSFRRSRFWWQFCTNFNLFRLLACCCCWRRSVNVRRKKKKNLNLPNVYYCSLTFVITENVRQTHNFSVLLSLILSYTFVVSEQKRKREIIWCGKMRHTLITLLKINCWHLGNLIYLFCFVLDEERNVLSVFDSVSYMGFFLGLVWLVIFCFPLWLIFLYSLFTYTHTRLWCAWCLGSLRVLLLWQINA